MYHSRGIKINRNPRERSLVGLYNSPLDRAAGGDGGHVAAEAQRALGGRAGARADHDAHDHCQQHQHRQRAHHYVIWNNHCMLKLWWWKRKLEMT